MSICSKKFLQHLLLQAAILVSGPAPAIMQASEYTDAIEQPSVWGTKPKSNPVPEFTPFDWSAQPAYIIQGNICSNIAGAGITTCSPVIFVLDPPNNRMLIDLGTQGKYYILENESFITGALPTCARVLKPDGTNFTYADQVAGYKTVVAMPESTTKKAHYFGLALDVGSCQDRIAAEFYVRDGFLSEFNFTQMYPFPGLGCASVTGAITFKANSIDTKSPRDPYFVLPADCTNAAPSFCPAVFFPGNPCDTCH